MVREHAAPAALVLYAIFGSSRHLVVGPMAATAALSAGAIADVATEMTKIAHPFDKGQKGQKGIEG